MEKERINVAELLKDCPKGMELDDVMYDNVKLDYVLKGHLYPIKVQTPEGQISLNKYGCYSNNKHAKCVIFPKGKTTWEGFQRPFVDGDVLAYNPKVGKTTIYIYRLQKTMNTGYYVALSGIQEILLIETNPEAALNGYNETVRFATESEKQKLFDAIKNNGYKWNSETKTLEELPKFKAGDWIIRSAEGFKHSTYLVTEVEDFYVCETLKGERVTITFNDVHKNFKLWSISDAKAGDVLVDSSPFIFKLIDADRHSYAYCGISLDGDFRIKSEGESDEWTWAQNIKPATKEQRDLLFQKMKDAGYKWNEEKKILEKLIVPNFKVGDVIQDKDTYKVKITSIFLEEEMYGYESIIPGGIGTIGFEKQDEWELVPDKFDITTLIPFESRVLVRDRQTEKWRPAIFGFHTYGANYYILGGSWWKYCIPYEGNEHLMGKNNDCADYYKSWE